MPNTIGSIPHMEEEGLACFRQALAQSRCFLEYGSGASTVYACNEARVATVISVESDAAWAKKVRASIPVSSSTLYLQHCDIGEVGDWGRPKSAGGIYGYWKYMATPWHVAKQHGYSPDLVLIDGRFRVACFLYSLLAAAPGTTILFDDYADRPNYFVVEKFCKPAARHGRMAAFVSAHDFSVTELAEHIAQYSIVAD